MVFLCFHCFDLNFQKIVSEKKSKYFFSMMKKYFCPDFFQVKSSRTVGIENGQKLDKTPPETGDTVPNGRWGRKKDLEWENLGEIQSAVLWTATISEVCLLCHVALIISRFQLTIALNTVLPNMRYNFSVAQLDLAARQLELAEHDRGRVDPAVVVLDAHLRIDPAE